MSLSPQDLELVELLNQPAPVGARFGITRYLYDMYRTRRDLLTLFPDLERDGEAFVEWVHVHGRTEVPIIDELLPPPPSEFRHFIPGAGRPDAGARPWWGVNVVGHLAAEVGLGEAARLVIAGLDAADVPLLPVEPATRPPSRHAHAFEAIPPAAAGFPINILSTTMPGFSVLRREVGRDLFDGRFTIGQCWWEVDGPLPFEWRDGFPLLDEVWCASEYATHCLGPQLQVPVHTITLPVALPVPPLISRAELGFPEGYLFLFVFDHGSTLKRKNPQAVIEAFMRTFAPGEGAALAIKCINPSHNPEGHSRLRALAAEHPDIRVIDHYVASEHKNAMIAACDCYVSLHRGEGFGLTAAEAMYLGKPVIATGYSGNLEFMTESNSHLVDYKLTNVGEGAWPYPPTGSWAEPNVDHAAALMRRVFEDRDAARELGFKAARDIRRTHSPKVAGAAMRSRLEEIAEELQARERAAGAAGGIDAAPVAALLRRGPVPPPHSSAGPLGAFLRRLLFRVLRPYTAHQHQIDEQLVAVLEEAAQESRAGAVSLARARSLERAQAHGRAAELKPAREREAAGRRTAPARVDRPASNGSGVASNGAPPDRGTASGADGAAGAAEGGELQARVDSVPFWWHTIDLGHGVVTPGRKAASLEGELLSLRLPDLVGKTVLDIGAWDGYYSFETERRGARRVVALDHFVWSIDVDACPVPADSRHLPPPDAPGVWRPDTLPGKRGFDTTCEALGSNVEPMVADFMATDPATIGTFDVVLFLGVLYHLEDPLGALRRLAAVTGDVAIIETEAIVVRDEGASALCEFFSDDQLAGDSTNWWAPNLAAIQGLLRVAGFEHSVAVKEPPPMSDDGPGVMHYRAVVHAYKHAPRDTSLETPPAGAVSVSTDVGELWFPGDCHVVTPALQRTGSLYPDREAVLREALCPGMTVVDVGAHVGYLALLAAQLVGPGGRVIAVEPGPENFALLEANTQRTGADHLCATHAAAWHESGSLELWLSPDSSGDHRAFPAEEARSKVEVPAIRIDELLATEAHVDYVLLDTGGSEPAVLEGMSSTLARFGPVLQLAFWPQAIREFGRDPIELLAACRRLGYEIHVLGEDGSADAEDGAICELAEHAPGARCTLILRPSG
jgi:FkbM family methyltransferase